MPRSPLDHPGDHSEGHRAEQFSKIEHAAAPNNSAKALHRRTADHDVPSARAKEFLKIDRKAQGQ